MNIFTRLFSRRAREKARLDNEMERIVAHELHVQPSTVSTRHRSVMRCARLMELIAAGRGRSFELELERRTGELAARNIILPDTPEEVRALAEELK